MYCHNNCHNNRINFDQLLRKSERNYNNKAVLNIENLSKHSPKEFWSKIKKMGPSKHDIPLKIEKNGTFITETKEVLETWKTEFKQLYSPNLESVDTQFETEIDKRKVELENVGYNNIQTSLNIPIQLSEVEKAIRSCKKNKRPGIDQIPNEVIKHPNVTKLLFKLFDYCFKTCLVPKMWLKSIIKPIPKNSEKNPFLPLNYRGISHVSCISKIYSSILNNRLTHIWKKIKFLLMSRTVSGNLDLAKIIYLSYLQ